MLLLATVVRERLLSYETRLRAGEILPTRPDAR